MGRFYTFPNITTLVQEQSKAGRMDPCSVLNYLLYSTNYDLYLTGATFSYKYKDMKGVVCFTDSGNSISGATLTI